MFKRTITLIVIVSFLLSYYQPACAAKGGVYAQLAPPQAGEFSINQLPVPGEMVGVSAPLVPLALKGLIVNPHKPLEFQFIIDTGNSLPPRGEGKGEGHQEQLKTESTKLIKYFLAGLTIPEGDLWVNLSPYEKSRMLPMALGQTELGADLLAQDYILKQLSASLIYPEKDLGKEFWSRVYKKAQAQFGTTNIPINTFNKVWIIPNEAQVFEHGPAAYVTKATLKVMLDEDYLATKKHQGLPGDNSVNQNCQPALCRANEALNLKAPQGNPVSTTNLASQLIRQLILPEIEHEVNTGKSFAPLRQIYDALILSKWYKQTIANGLLNALYTNKNKVTGVNINNPAIKEEIYNRYLQAYKKGVFNYIKDSETPNGVSDATLEKSVPRKYFSGGLRLMPPKVKNDGSMFGFKPDGALIALKVDLFKDGAMESLQSPDEIATRILALRGGLIRGREGTIIDPYKEPVAAEGQPIQVLIKPETTASQEAIRDAIIFFRSHGYGIQNITLWPGKTLRVLRVIRKHYGVSAEAALEGISYIKKSPALEKRLGEIFHIDDRTVIYGGQEMVEKGLATPGEVNDLSNEAIKQKHFYKLGPGIYVVNVNFRGHEIIIINGHMPYLIDFFENKNAVTVAIRLAPLEGKSATPLLELRDALGATDISKAEPTTLRGQYFQNLKARGLFPVYEKDPKMINGYHLSASYLEALCESVLWGADLRMQPLAQRLVVLGMSWSGVEYLVTSQPKDVLDATEKLATPEEVAQTIVKNFRERIEEGAIEHNGFVAKESPQPWTEARKSMTLVMNRMNEEGQPALLAVMAFQGDGHAAWGLKFLGSHIELAKKINLRAGTYTVYAGVSLTINPEGSVTIYNSGLSDPRKFYGEEASFFGLDRSKIPLDHPFNDQYFNSFLQRQVYLAARLLIEAHQEYGKYITNGITQDLFKDWAGGTIEEFVAKYSSLFDGIGFASKDKPQTWDLARGLIAGRMREVKESTGVGTYTGAMTFRGDDQVAWGFGSGKISHAIIANEIKLHSIDMQFAGLNITIDDATGEMLIVPSGLSNPSLYYGSDASFYGLDAGNIPVKGDDYSEGRFRTFLQIQTFLAAKLLIESDPRFEGYRMTVDAKLFKGWPAGSVRQFVSDFSALAESSDKAAMATKDNPQEWKLARKLMEERMERVRLATGAKVFNAAMAFRSDGLVAWQIFSKYQDHSDIAAMIKLYIHGLEYAGLRITYGDVGDVLIMPSGLSNPRNCYGVEAAFYGLDTSTIPSKDEAFTNLAFKYFLQRQVYLAARLLLAADPGLANHHLLIPSALFDDWKGKRMGDFIRNYSKAFKLKGDAGMVTNQVGGIDLNQINIKDQGQLIKVQFDAAELHELMQGGFEGFIPMIEDFQYIKSPFPLLGVG